VHGLLAHAEYRRDALPAHSSGSSAENVVVLLNLESSAPPGDVLERRQWVAIAWSGGAYGLHAQRLVRDICNVNVA
jgi:hypothetical protein